MSAWQEAMTAVSYGARYSALNPPHSTAGAGASLPTDVATLHAIINTLEVQLKATSVVITHLAASVARLETERASISPTPAAPTNTAPPTTTTPSTTGTTTPLICQHSSNPCTIASGRGAGSQDVFQELIKTNWHGRLGRAHMVDVDALPYQTLTRLDSLLRRKLRATYPHGSPKVESEFDVDVISAELAALGLRLEDRGEYAHADCTLSGATLHSCPTKKRGMETVAMRLTHKQYANYFHGLAMETVVELARYRGLFDGAGFLNL